ncbi:MAG: LytR family transcriptional regulator [Clostridiales bacterium]|nr:LytR family transcriptional regulator [Clostridiales bacterium]
MEGVPMLKRLLCLMLVLLAALPFAAAEDGTTGYTNDELLDMMAVIPEEGEKDNSAFLVLPEDIPMPPDNTYTILLVGSDAYDDDNRGRSDTTILVQVDGESKTVRMASFLRDMYVKIPGKGSNRINASYIWGGHELLRKTLETNFGVTADAYVEVNFERLVKVIDAIGGVEVEVSEAERQQVNSILKFYNEKIGDRVEDQLLQESGLVNLTGKQALCYSRIRKIDSDHQRTGRQRKVLEAAFQKVTQLSMAEISLLILQNMDAVQTDLSLTDAIDLIPLALRCKNATFETLTIPVSGAYTSTTIDGMAVLRPNLKKNQQALKEFFGLE